MAGEDIVGGDIKGEDIVGDIVGDGTVDGEDSGGPDNEEMDTVGVDNDGEDIVMVGSPSDKLTQTRSAQPNGSKDVELLKGPVWVTVGEGNVGVDKDGEDRFGEDKVRVDMAGLGSVEVTSPNDKLTQIRSEQPNGREDEELLDEAVEVTSEDDVIPKPPPNEALNDALTHNRSWQPNGRDEVELLNGKLLDGRRPLGVDILNPTLADALNDTEALKEALRQIRSLHPYGKDDEVGREIDPVGVIGGVVMLRLPDSEALSDALTQRRLLHSNGKDVLDETVPIWLRLDDELVVGVEELPVWLDEVVDPREDELPVFDVTEDVCEPDEPEELEDMDDPETDEIVLDRMMFGPPTRLMLKKEMSLLLKRLRSRLRQANPWQLEDAWDAEFLEEAVERDDLEVSDEIIPLDVHPGPMQRLTQASPLQEVEGVVAELEVTSAEEPLDAEELEVTEPPVLVTVDGDELQPAPMQTLKHPTPSHDVVGAAGEKDVEELETLTWEEVELPELEEIVLDVTVLLTTEEGQPRPMQMLTQAKLTEVVKLEDRVVDVTGLLVEEGQPNPMQILTHASPWHEVVYVAGELDVVESEENVDEELAEVVKLEDRVLEVTVALVEGQPRPRQILTHARPWHDVVYVAGRLEVVESDEVNEVMERLELAEIDGLV
ncbi:MAG: hypothetical protein Q9167_005703 [Letrouitia subvulpina]